MEYLLIGFIIAVVLSPLAWFKTSPYQKRVAEFRQQARVQGLQVQLVPEVDAGEEETRPEAVRYFLPFQAKRVAEVSPGGGSWTLLRNHRRGWDSPWAGWKWFRGEASGAGLSQIADAINSLPDTVYGIRSEPTGVSLYLRETGDVEAVSRCSVALKSLVGATGD